MERLGLVKIGGRFGAGTAGRGPAESRQGLADFGRSGLDRAESEDQGQCAEQEKHHIGSQREPFAAGVVGDIGKKQVSDRQRDEQRQEHHAKYGIQ